MKNWVFFRGLILILTLLILFFGIACFITKRFKNKKRGKIIGVGVFSLLGLFTTYLFIGFPFFLGKNYFFFQSSALRNLEYVEVVLYDDFTILDNSFSSFTSKHHEFVLKISEKDKRRLLGDFSFGSDEIVQVTYQDNGYYSIEVSVSTTDKNLLYYKYAD